MMVLFNKKNDFSYAALLVVVIYALFPMFKAVGAIGSAVLLLLGLGAMLKGGVVKAHLLQLFPLALPFLVLFALSVLGMFYGTADMPERWDYLSKSLRFVALISGGYFLYRCNLEKLALKAFCASMAVTMCLVYASVFIPMPWAPQVEQQWGGDHTMWGDYITQNIMMVFFAVCLLHGALQASTKAHRVVLGIGFVLASVCILVLSVGRTGYVMLFGALLVYAFVAHAGWKLRLLALGVAVTVVFLLYTQVTAFQARVDLAYAEFMAADGKNTITSIGARLLMWSTAVQLGWEHLWWGVGSGSYAGQWCAVMNDAAWCDIGQHPHNQFLLLFASNGIFAVLAYLSIFIGGLYCVSRSQSPQRLVVLMFLMLLGIDSVLNGPFWNVREANFFAMLGSVVFALLLKEKAVGP